MLIDELGLDVADLVAIDKEEDKIVIKRLMWVPKSDEPKPIGFFGDFKRSEGKRKARFNELSSNPEPCAEVFYRKRDYMGDFIDLTFNAGPASFVRRFQEIGGDMRLLQQEYREVFGEDWN